MKKNMLIALGIAFSCIVIIIVILIGLDLLGEQHNQNSIEVIEFDFDHQEDVVIFEVWVSNHDDHSNTFSIECVVRMEADPSNISEYQDYNKTIEFTIGPNDIESYKISVPIPSSLQIRLYRVYLHE